MMLVKKLIIFFQTVKDGLHQISGRWAILSWAQNKKIIFYYTFWKLDEGDRVFRMTYPWLLTLTKINIVDYLANQLKKNPKQKYYPLEKDFSRSNSWSSKTCQSQQVMLTLQNLLLPNSKTSEVVLCSHSRIINSSFIQQPSLPWVVQDLSSTAFQYNFSQFERPPENFLLAFTLKEKTLTNYQQSRRTQLS